VTHRPLYSQAEIEKRVNEMADRIAAMPDPPEIAAPILVGAFVFAADLLRALANRGVSLRVEFLWLRSYADAREPSESVVILIPSGPPVRNAHVLLLDGVLDRGGTLATARRLLHDAGARRITTAVAVDKLRGDALLRADHAAFAGVDRFIVGYGMDDAGRERCLPYIAALD
jgi:hypoxanthine phosphoribosyltransferase